MTMLRMFKRNTYNLLPSEEAETYLATMRERDILALYTRRFVNRTAAEVASALEQFHARTGPDEIMLVRMGASRPAYALSSSSRTSTPCPWVAPFALALER